MAGVTIKNLSKTFEIDKHKFRALKDVNLTVEDKSFVTVIGKSGCGKTTLLRILCGLEKKTSGSFGLTKSGGKDDKKIAIVFQEPRLMPWLTVQENMKFPLMHCKDKDYVNALVYTNLKLLGLYKFKDAYPSQISGGMAQRTALGRTLCYDPQIILMDEPLSALDAFTKKNLQNELINIFLKNHKTIIFVTHDIEEALYLGQKIVLMDNGSIIREMNIDMNYYRNVDSADFLNYKNKILKICNTLWRKQN